MASEAFLRVGVHAEHAHYKWWALSCTSLGMLLATLNSGTLIIALLAAMTTLEAHSPYWQSALWLTLVGVGSGIFNSPNTAAMMAIVPPHRRGIAGAARMLLTNAGAVLSIAFVLAVVTSAVPKDALFEIFSGLASGLTSAQLAPFIQHMHLALWVLAAVSLVGAGISLLRPGHHAHR